MSFFFLDNLIYTEFGNLHTSLDCDRDALALRAISKGEGRYA